MGREVHYKQISLACGECSVSGPHCVCPHSWRVCFPGLQCSGSRLLCQELSEVGPGLYAFPRSKLLRFRFLGTPQRHRLCWACILCLSQVRGAQATRCLVSTFSPGGRCILSPPWSQPLGFLGVQWGHHLRCAVCLLWGADLWLWPSWPISIIQDPRKTWLATGSLIAVW